MSIKIDQNLFREQILSGFTNPQLQEYWKCGKSTINSRKKEWGLVGLSPNSKPRDTSLSHKKCSICNEEKLLSDFYSNGYTSKNQKKFKPNCKSCENTLVYNRYVQKILSCLEEKNRHLACEVCGYDSVKSALHFHHYKGIKNFEISSAKTKSKEALSKEIDLCKILCANCHSIEHKTRIL